MLSITDLIKLSSPEIKQLQVFVCHLRNFNHLTVECIKNPMERFYFYFLGFLLQNRISFISVLFIYYYFTCLLPKEFLYKIFSKVIQVSFCRSLVTVVSLKSALHVRLLTFHRVITPSSWGSRIVQNRF